MRGAVVFICALALFGAASAKEDLKKESAATATPASKLLQDAINNIRARIEQTERDDLARNTVIQANCSRDDQILAGRIADKQADIDAQNKLIAQSKADIASLESQISTTESDRDTAEGEKAEREKQVIDGDKQRAIDAELFQNNTDDTIVAIEAIGEIKDIIGNSSLQSNENDDKTDYADQSLDTGYQAGINEQRAGPAYDATGDEYANSVSEKLAQPALLTTHTSGLLRKLAGKVNDPMVRSFIEMAALSAAALDKGDVTKLIDLLDRLDAELKKYKQELYDAEQQAISDWNTLKAKLNAEIESLTAEIARLEGVIDALNNALTKEKENLAKLEAGLAKLEKEKRDLEAQRRALDKMCADEQTDYEERNARREEELKTLDRIQLVINEKLNTATDQTKSGSSYEGEFGYNWVKGEWGPCESGVQTVRLYCVGPDGKQVEDMPELSCGPKPKGLRKACPVQVFRHY